MTAELSLSSLLVNYVRAALAVLRRDWAVFASYRTRMIGQVVSAVMMVVMFRFISRLVHVSQFQTSDAYFGFAVVGVVTLQVLTSTLHTPAATVRQELVAGTFERLVLSPFGAVMSTVSMMIFPLLSVIVTGIITLAAATIGFGLPLHWPSAALALPAALLGATSFMPFGIALAAVTLAFKQAISAATYIVALIGLVAGFYFPVSLLPAWIRWTSDVQPFTPSVDLVRHFLLGSPLRVSAWVDIAKVAGFTVALLPISALMLGTAVEFGRRRGTITEY
jgi:ABC-2 type transport system permease protein